MWPFTATISDVNILSFAKGADIWSVYPTGNDGKFQKHVRSRCHSVAHHCYITAKSVASNPSKSANVMLSEENKRVLAQTEIERNENREAVGMIIDSTPQVVQSCKLHT